MSSPQVTQQTEVGSQRAKCALQLRTRAILKWPPSTVEQSNGSDCSQLSAIRLAADGAMVKHDLTIRVASRCAIDVSSDLPLRKSLLICNALVPAVTRVT